MVSKILHIVNKLVMTDMKKNEAGEGDREKGVPAGEAACAYA